MKLSYTHPGWDKAGQGVTGDSFWVAVLVYCHHCAPEGGFAVRLKLQYWTCARSLWGKCCASLESFLLSGLSCLCLSACTPQFLSALLLCSVSVAGFAEHSALGDPCSVPRGSAKSCIAANTSFVVGFCQKLKYKYFKNPSFQIMI